MRRALLLTLLLLAVPATAGAQAPTAAEQAKQALQTAKRLAEGRGVRSGRELSPALQQLAVQRSKLSADEREQADELLARPTDPTDLTDLIRTVAPRLTGALREVADTVLADPAEAARLSAVALAARAGVSQASVTRFAQSIGLASHAELRLALAEQKGRSTAPGVAMDVGVQIHPDDSVRQVIKVVANADIRAITQTVNQLDHHALDLASRAIAAAQRVDVYGIGSSASVAYELETRLFRVGVRVRAWTEVHEALTSAALLTPDDVAIAISHSGATSEVVEPLRLAADRGAVTVGLTGDPRSAVAAASLHMLTTAALETSYRNGSLAARHSQMMIADCLYIRVVQLTPERAAESMALTEHIAAVRETGRKTDVVHFLAEGFAGRFHPG